MAQDVIAMIQSFVTGQDTSVGLAQEIEVAIDDRYPDDEFLQETVEMLAMYRPAGGELLFDVDAIRRRLAEVLAYLRKN